MRLPKGLKLEIIGFGSFAAAVSAKAEKKFGDEDLKAKPGDYYNYLLFHLELSFIYYMNI